MTKWLIAGVAAIAVTLGTASTTKHVRHQGPMSASKESRLINSFPRNAFGYDYDEPFSTPRPLGVMDFGACARSGYHANYDNMCNHHNGNPNGG